ncbi:unnamed protein product, partial [marine sediment metagenome]
QNSPFAVTVDRVIEHAQFTDQELAFRTAIDGASILFIFREHLCK